MEKRGGEANLVDGLVELRRGDASGCKKESRVGEERTVAESSASVAMVGEGEGEGDETRRGEGERGERGEGGSECELEGRGARVE